MRLYDLATAVERLTATRSRAEIVSLIADLLNRAEAEDRAPLIYLLQAQLRPAYEGVETGMGEKLIVRAIAQAYSVAESAVDRRSKAAGDLGRVAELLAPDRTSKRMTVHHAYTTLLTLARTTGEGVVTRKISLLAELLSAITPVEAKLIVRIVQGRLRLGIGDQTILDAIALGALGDRRKQPIVVHAYNVRADLGEVATLAFREGESALKTLRPTIGTPIRPALAERLPSAQAILERLGEVQAEPKYDGFRLQLHRDGDRVWIFSRRLENVTAMFPELVEAAKRQLTTRRVILEGEAIAYDAKTNAFLPFQVTMTRKRKRDVSTVSERHPIRLFVFDLLYAGRTNYLPKPQHERSDALGPLLTTRRGKRAASAPIVVTEKIVTKQAGTLDRYFQEMLRRGLEGVLAKRRDAPYQAGARNYTWVKLKPSYESQLRDTIDVVLVGYIRGRGKRAKFGIGSLLAAVYDPKHDRFRTVAKIGSGLSDTAWEAMRKRLDARATQGAPRRVDSHIVPDVWVEPTYVVEVLADEITRSPLHTCGKTGDQPGYALRFPRMVNGIRADKGPTEATTEQEILELYRLQSRAPRSRHAKRS